MLLILNTCFVSFICQYSGETIGSICSTKSHQYLNQPERIHRETMSGLSQTEHGKTTPHGRIPIIRIGGVISKAAPVYFGITSVWSTIAQWCHWWSKLSQKNPTWGTHSGYSRAQGDGRSKYSPRASIVHPCQSYPDRPFSNCFRKSLAGSCWGY